MNVNKVHDYANMSQASYLGLDDVVLGSSTSLSEQLIGDSYNSDNRFANGQAQSFIDPISGYSLVSQRTNTASGFSATVGW